MRTFFSLFVLAASLLISGPVCAQLEDDRPKIGLALSGGGTKAGAHIGVLRVLEENRVPIDYIAGTSAGAIIGSLYAAGLSPDEIEAAIAEIDWEDILEDRTGRADLPYRRKRDTFNYLVKYRPGYNDGEFTFPLGLVQGQKVTQFFRRHFNAYAGPRDFDELPIPLRVVATDLTNGDAVVIGEGDLALAVRASMSIPVFFAPVRMDGRLLVDGGPANNLPVEIVRQMGADVVIAVDITSRLLHDEEIDTAVSVADQMTNILVQRTVQEQIATLTADDILIRPDLEDVGGLDFSRTLEPIAAGKQAANSIALAHLSLGEGAYLEHMAVRTDSASTAVETIEFVDINNASSFSTDSIQERLGLRAGDPVDIDLIEKGIADVYSLDLFERIDYRLERADSGTGLHLDVIPKQWGPNYLQFGLELSEDFSQGSDFNLGVAYLQTSVNSLGGEWRAQIDLGERQGLGFDWYQPLSHGSRLFVEAEAVVARRNFRLFEQGAAIADVRVEGWGGTLSAGSEIGDSAEFRLGWSRFAGNGDVTVGAFGLEDDSVEVGEYFASLRFDRLDNVNFPRRGAAGAVGASWSRESAGADSNFEQIVGGLFFAKSWGDLSVLTSIEGGTTLDDDAPLQSQFLLGGLGRLSGFPATRFAGQHYGLASVTPFYRVGRNLWLPVYAGMSLEAGNVWQQSDEMRFDNLRFAGALFAGVDTPLGPLYLAYGLAEGGNDTFYLHLGNPFVSEGARPLD